MFTHKFVVALLAVPLLALAGCGGGGDEFTLPPSTGSAGGTGGGPAYDPATATGTIRGNILFEGTAPAVRPVPVNDPECSVQVLDESVLVTDDSKLQNVIVYVASGHPAASYPVPSEPILLNQEGCHYTPHIFTMVASQPLLIRNSDPTTHNIHATPQLNMVINFAQPRQGNENTQTFLVPEYMPPIPIICDVHKWMSAFAGVFDHPFHTTSAATGTYSISVPPGTYEIMTWHEEYGEMGTSVTVSDGETVDLDFTYSAG
jgi:hypothetical protein